MLILHNYMTLESAIGQFGDTEVSNGEGKTVTCNNFGVTFLCVVECLIDAVMESVCTSRKGLEEAMVKGQGRNIGMYRFRTSTKWVCMYACLW